MLIFGSWDDNRIWNFESNETIVFQTGGPFKNRTEPDFLWIDHSVVFAQDNQAFMVSVLSGEILHHIELDTSVEILAVHVDETNQSILLITSPGELLRWIPASNDIQSINSINLPSDVSDLKYSIDQRGVSQIHYEKDDDVWLQSGDAADWLYRYESTIGQSPSIFSPIGEFIAIITSPHVVFFSTYDGRMIKEIDICHIWCGFDPPRIYTLDFNENGHVMILIRDEIQLWHLPELDTSQD